MLILIFHLPFLVFSFHLALSMEKKWGVVGQKQEKSLEKNFDNFVNSNINIKHN